MYAEYAYLLFSFSSGSPLFGEGSIDKKLLMHSGFWSLRGWGEGGLSESVKKGKFLTKIFFLVHVE